MPETRDSNPLLSKPPFFASLIQLEELEVLLREDVQDEVSNWGGRILLHQELPPAQQQPGAPGSGAGGEYRCRVQIEGADEGSR